jgi:hypothetical protein
LPAWLSVGCVSSIRLVAASVHAKIKNQPEVRFRTCVSQK